MIEDEHTSATLLGLLTEGVIRIDAEGRVGSINAAAAALVGWSAEEALGRPLDAVLEAREEWSSDSVLAPPRPDADARVVSRGGEQHLVRILRRALPDGEILVLQDRTRERKDAHRLAYADRLANAGALAAVRLSAVARILDEATSAPPEEAARACAEVRWRVGQALGLLAEPWSEALVSDVGDAARWVASFLPVGGATLRLALPAGLEVALPAGSLQQALANVVGNALRAAGPGGTVEVSGRRVAGTVEIDVVDDGPGPRHPEDLVFQPYFSTIPGAHGLGLSVVRDIVGTAGGSVSLTTRGGRTRVRLALPADARG